MALSIDQIPPPAAETGRALRDGLTGILGEDLVALWIYGGTTFPGQGGASGDLDVCGVVTGLAPEERDPAQWMALPDSRPQRVLALQEDLEHRYGLLVDAIYVCADDARSGRAPGDAFCLPRLLSCWAVDRAHLLSGQYVPLHGPRPEDLIGAPTPEEIRHALDRELEHLERHVYEGDAADPAEAAYGLLNGCRILFTLDTGSPVISKQDAGAWGLEHLPTAWHGPLAAARRVHGGRASARDADVLQEALRPFVELVRRLLPATEPRPPGPPRWSGVWPAHQGQPADQGQPPDP